MTTPTPTPNQQIVATLAGTIRIRAIASQATSFQQDVAANWPTSRGQLSAATIDRVDRLFDSLIWNAQHAERFANNGDENYRVHHLVAAAHVTGKLSEIFHRHKREGWVSRSEALARVVRNAIVNVDMPV